MNSDVIQPMNSQETPTTMDGRPASSRHPTAGEESRVVHDPLSRLLTVAEVAALLNVPRKWVYRRVVLKPPEGIPHVKVGKYLRFRESDLRTYVDRLRRN